MFLKSIEIRGFKSFADKTELNLKKGITGVVGPNGSGKSNVSDAVRWVLGEQSVKSLRGAKMEDIIFAGTEFRKPLGVAQVSLVLDNEQGDLKIQYSQVKITRRLYRSGESDYFINNSKCRLKDIQELFMDTGIGKEGYSIIGQGKIDAILSGKSEERRALLEEAAGIVKFKTRKEDAEKKLENTKENLVRIVDILNTYEERLEPLRIEMEKAKKFLDLANELKNKDLALTINTVGNIDDKISTLADSNKINNELIDKYKHEQSMLKENLNDQKDFLEQYDMKTKTNRESYYKSKENINNICNHIKIIEEKINNLNSLIVSNEKETENLNIELLNLNTKKSELSKEIEFMEGENKGFISSIDSIDKEIKEIESDMEEKVKNNIELNNELNALIQKINDNNQYRDSSHREVKIFKEKIESICVSIENMHNSLKINNTTKRALENQGETILYEISKLEEMIKSITQKLGSLRTKLKNEENKNKKKEIELNKEEQRLNLLLDLENQHEGYSKTTKLLMEHIKKGLVGEKGICNVLGDIIEVDEKYEKAIEISLGSSISNIITSHEDQAKSLIEYLKDKKLGRATFLPLNIIKERSLSSIGILQRQSGFVGSASSLVKCKDEFRKAIEFTLGNIIIAQDMNEAIKIAKIINYSNRIVTLSGDVVNVGGSLTGGSTYAKGSNIISRKREINTCEINIKNIRVELKNTSENLDKYNNELIELDEKNLNFKEEVHSKNIDYVKLKEKINSLCDEENRCNELIKNYNDELAEANSKINFFKNNLKNTEKEILSLESSKEQLMHKISLGEQNLKVYNKGIESKKELLFNFKLELAKITENLYNKKETLKTIVKTLEDKSNKIKELESEKDKNSLEIETFKGEIVNGNEKLNLLNNDIKLLEEGFIIEEQESLSIKEKIKNIESNLEQTLLEQEKIEKDKGKIMVQLTRLETEKNGIMDKLNEEYKITYAEALDYKNEDLDYNNTKKEIETLKQSINDLGIVNVGAIEEYKEVKSKYSFMKEQQLDLEQSKKEIMEMIEEMTFKMKKVFRENFDILNEYFHETFKELFKGGRASLILTEGDELSGKIEINVQPPGKKLQNINLMSGGEKVLSAIALLFSILKMKPTPFCILDEIEAALDDANVARYAEFLKKFSDRIQFIVITHRKGTMEVSHALYGVTMEEKGISKVVSVNLNKNINI